MKNQKLEKSKCLFKEYLENKESILKNEESKYIWYLNLEDIIFKFLGVNRSVHLNSNGIRNFPTYLYESSYNCSQEEAQKHLNEIADFLDKVEIEYKELRNVLNLEQYIKSSIYKNKYFNIKSDYSNYDNIELISITTKDKTNVYYEVSESDEYTMKKHREDKDYFFKKAIGTFKKDDIKFNVNKNHISKLVILEDSVEKEFTVKSFEKKYGNLNDFMYKELNNFNIKNEDILIDKALELVSNFINVRAIADIYFKEELPFTGSRKAVGRYAFGDIYVTTKPTHTHKLEILVHEIGHFIHEEYFDEKQFRFSTKGKTKYARKNHRENFAECFTDLIYRRIDNERTRKMIKILNEIV